MPLSPVDKQALACSCPLRPQRRLNVARRLLRGARVSPSRRGHCASLCPLSLCSCATASRTYGFVSAVQLQTWSTSPHGEQFDAMGPGKQRSTRFVLDHAHPRAEKPRWRVRGIGSCHSAVRVKAPLPGVRAWQRGSLGTGAPTSRHATRRAREPTRRQTARRKPKITELHPSTKQSRSCEQKGWRLTHGHSAGRICTHLDLAIVATDKDLACGTRIRDVREIGTQSASHTGSSRC